MNRLFWKIFISFWLTLILFAVATFFSASIYLDNIRTQQDATNYRSVISQYINEGQEIANSKGIAGLKDWLATLDRTEAIPFLFVDTSGNDLLGRAVPTRMMRWIERLERRRHTGDHAKRSHHRRPITLADGRKYRLLPDFQNITLGRVLQRPRVIAVPLLIAALASGLVCLALARYLSAPLGRLRRATDQLASGDLGLRIAPSMGNRKDEIADLARDFDHMAERLERLLTAQKQLLRDASHELRSPLARLQAALGLARQSKDGEIDSQLDRIELETERLNELIGSLLSLARLEADTIELPKERISLDELIEDIIQDAAFEAASKNRHVQLTHSISAEIMANSTLLHSAIDNVVRNAIKYTEEHSCVEIAMHMHNKEQTTICIEVRDYGPGVPDDMLPHLFEPFVRVGEARDRDSGGYGLGLSIAERAIKLHGGDIAAYNAEGGGVSMKILLPILQ